MTDLVDFENPELVADDAKGHEDATKAGRGGPGQSPKRGQESRSGDTKIVKPVSGAVMHTTVRSKLCHLKTQFQLYVVGFILAQANY